MSLTLTAQSVDGQWTPIAHRVLSLFPGLRNGDIAIRARSSTTCSCTGYALDVTRYMNRPWSMPSHEFYPGDRSSLRSGALEAWGLWRSAGTVRRSSAWTPGSARRRHAWLLPLPALPLGGRGCPGVTDEMIVGPDPTNSASTPRSSKRRRLLMVAGMADAMTFYPGRTQRVRPQWG